MKPDDLLRAAQDAIATANRLIPGAKPHMYLTLPPRKDPGNRVRLLGRSGPLGELCAVNHDNRIVAQFNPHEVIAFLTRKGLANSAGT